MARDCKGRETAADLFTIDLVRRFEYVGGTSSKFWEISRLGSEVTVAFGRIGTNGQRQVKDLGSEAAAIVHVDKLVAEKVGKGYVESKDASEAAIPAPAATTPSSTLVAAAAPPRSEAVPPIQSSARRPGWPDILPWKRTQDSESSRALAAEIKRLAVSGSNGSGASEAITKLIVESSEADVRSALQTLLKEPDVLFPDNYWFRPTSGFMRLSNIQKAAEDPKTAQLAAQALIRIHEKRPGWGFEQAGDVLGAMLVRAIAHVSDADLPRTVGALLELIAYINTMRSRVVYNVTIPPGPPPRFILEAVGVLQARNEELTWRVIDELAQGPSSLAKVLRHVASIKSGALALHGLADPVLKLIELASELKGSPTKAWLQRWEEIKTGAPAGLREALIALTLNGEVSPDLTFGGSATDIPRAAMTALASWHDPETRAFLRKAILNWSRSGMGAPVVGTAAVWSLASYGDRDAVATMLDIRRRIHHKNLLKRLTQEIDRLSQKLGVNPDDIADESVDDCGLDATGSSSWTLGGYTISVKIGEQGGIARVVTRGGKEVKDVPAAVRKENATTWSEITAASKLIKETISAQRQRLEMAMVDGRSWELAQWDRVFRTHPILRNLARRLVWAIEAEGAFLALPVADGWSGSDGVRVLRQAHLKIAHAATMSAADQSYWQHRIVDEEIVQPFKQVFRETYFVTPAEVLDVDRSHRFSGHVIPNQMMYALAKGRGWSGTMGLSGFDGSGVGAREFPTWGVRASIEQDWTGGDEFSTIAEISFMQGDRDGLWRRARIDQVPTIPFSETMRDIDLVVAVASIGTDQQWLDWEARREAGTVNWTDQRQAYAGLASAAAGVRGQLLREMLPKLGLADRATVEGHFVHVRGKLGEYRVHLGSGNIHMEPSGRYLCIVAAPVKGDRMIYLPFEDPDLKSAEIVSKVLLLARDDKITDPVITAQLRSRA